MRYSEIIVEDAYEDLEKYVRYNTYISREMLDLIPNHPYRGGTIFRGFSFDTQESYDSFMDKISEGTIEITSASSWTRSLSIAREFATMEKSYDPTPSVIAGMKMMNQTGDFTYAYGGVVLETSVGDSIGLDVSAALGQSAEGEVILPAGNYTVDIKEVIVPYRRQYDSPEKIQALYDRIMADEDQDKIHFFTNTVLPHLSPEQITAYSNKAVAKEEQFFHSFVSSPKHGRDHLEVRFSPNFTESQFEGTSATVKQKIAAAADAEAKILIDELMKLPDEAFTNARSGIFLDAKPYVENWSTITRPVVARLSTIYRRANTEARGMKSTEEIRNFTKGITTLLSLLAGMA